MRHHSIVCRLGDVDAAPVTLSRHDTVVTEISFLDRHSKLKHGLGHAIEHIRGIGLCPSERAIDLLLLAGVLTAADTRISRETESQDRWTREIDLHLPVSEPGIWNGTTDLLANMLRFLTGDIWRIYFRQRPDGLRLAVPSESLRIFHPSSVSLFSGGLDSFIGAIDLFSEGERPLLVSHYWDGITSKHQGHCAEVLKQRFPGLFLEPLRARVGFPKNLVPGVKGENTLRGRSFLFFALATLAASAIGENVVVHVPENGLISLNVPLDPLRLGSLSTRTTHPYYMARFNELLITVGLGVRLENRYRHQTKGQMVAGCTDLVMLQREARDTMSCSAPTKYRYLHRGPMHCGHCVPCLIRRAALMHGLGQDDTPYAIADLHASTLDTNKARGTDVRSFQLALARLARNPDRARLEIHRPGPLVDHPDDLARYETVYIEGMHEVGRYLTGVQARPL